MNAPRLRKWSLIIGTICLLAGLIVFFLSTQFSLGWWVGGFFVLYGVFCLVSGIMGKRGKWVKELGTISFPAKDRSSEP